MHVDILTTFDQQTGHKRSFVLSTADGSTLRQTVMIPDGIGAFSMIMLRDRDRRFNNSLSSYEQKCRASRGATASRNNRY
jgi:hypothetical protein